MTTNKLEQVIGFCTYYDNGKNVELDATCSYNIGWIPSVDIPVKTFATKTIEEIQADIIKKFAENMNIEVTITKTLIKKIISDLKYRYWYEFSKLKNNKNDRLFK